MMVFVVSKPNTAEYRACINCFQGRIVSLCDDNSLHLWEINEGCLEEVKSQALEGK
jgi:hypothetical protein